MADDTQVVQKQETTEVVGTDNTNSTAVSLAGIFDAMEAGKEDGRSNKEIIAEANDKKAKEAKAEKKEEKVEATKAEETELDKKVKEQPKQEEDADPRKALQKAFEERQQKKDERVDEKKEGDEKKVEDEVPEDELKPLPNDKPKTVKRIQALLRKIETVSSEATKTKTERDEKATKLAELEEKLSKVQTVNPETDEKIKKQLDELAMYRRRYELDADPEVKSKFDGRVEAAEGAIVEVLKRRNAGEPLLKLIKDEGGWASFANSGRVVTIPDEDGGSKQVTSAELAELILGNLPLGERKAVESAMMEQMSTRREKERFFKEEQAKANDFFKKREDDAKKATEDQQKQVQEATKKVEDWRKSVESQDWIKDKELPEKATAEEKKQIEEYNRYNNQLRAFLKKAVSTSNLDGMLEIIEDSVKFYAERRTTAQLKDENTRLKAQLKAKDDEFAKFKNAGRSVPRSGSIATPASSDTQRTRAPQSLEEALTMKEQGMNLHVMTSNDE